MVQPIKVYVQAVPPSDGNEAQSGVSRPEEAVPATQPGASVQQPSSSPGVDDEGRDGPQAGPVQYRQLTQEAQYVPAAEPRKLVEILPAQYETTRPPLIYRLAKVSELGRPEARIGESRVYRAKAFSCGIFYKPISRCLVDWEDR